MRVSIVIDNYNYADYVAQTIESALAQTHPDVEIIVIDDGSSDRSMAVIERYGDRVQVFAKPNGGQASAYNLGLAKATGDLVTFVDADDWLYPEAMAEVVSAWRPGVSKVQFRLDMVDAQGQPLGRRVPRVMDDRNAGDLMRSFGTYGSPPGSGNVYHAAYLRQVMPLDEGPWRVGADTIPILLAPAFGDVVSLPQPLGAYRLHRSPDDPSLLFNNAPSGLQSEYERLVAAKRAVSTGMRQLGVVHGKPLGWAPWEARTVALCVRFGGDAVLRQLPGSPRSQIAGALASLWRWPGMPMHRKLALMGWVMAVAWLPEPLAMRLARLHRRSAGAPVAA